MDALRRHAYEGDAILKDSVFDRHRNQHSRNVNSKHDFERGRKVMNVMLHQWPP